MPIRVSIVCFLLGWEAFNTLCAFLNKFSILFNRKKNLPQTRVISQKS